jgi:hypothetical protein
LEARLSKATKRPSPLIAAAKDGPLPRAPSGPTETASVVPAARSRTKMSGQPFVSPSTRFDASEKNATTWPSPLIAGSVLPWFP